MLFAHIVGDIRNVNKKTKRQAQQRVCCLSFDYCWFLVLICVVCMQALQSFMFTMLKDENVVAARKSLDVMIELWCVCVLACLLVVFSHVCVCAQAQEGVGGRQMRECDCDGVFFQRQQTHALGALVFPRR